MKNSYKSPHPAPNKGKGFGNEAGSKSKKDKKTADAVYFFSYKYLDNRNNRPQIPV